MWVMFGCGIFFNFVFLTSTFLYRKQLGDEVKVFRIASMNFALTAFWKYRNLPLVSRIPSLMLCGYYLFISPAFEGLDYKIRILRKKKLEN